MVQRLPKAEFLRDDPWSIQSILSVAPGQYTLLSFYFNKNEVVLTLQDNRTLYGLDVPAELLSFRQFFRQVFELNRLIFRLGDQ
jgi:hypothetical protein